ncbi:MAG TPA: transposase [Candidatus Bathyarchaeia archaeon]|nr:transposase [Candidatus Bathyarchaeia archaeon]
MLAVKSVKQRYRPSPRVNELLEIFRCMVNDSIRIGLEKDASSLKRLSFFTYTSLKRYSSPSIYRLTAMSKAAGILASRKKSTRRGYPTKTPYMSRRALISCYGFKIEDGYLRIPLGEKKFELIPLTPHVVQILSDPLLNVRSFPLTETSLAFCMSREVEEVECNRTIGVDRNLRNLTVGNQDRVVQYDLSYTVKIADTTRRIISSFRRDDDRIREKLSPKYGRRRHNRTQHILHNTTKAVVVDAFKRREAIVLENIEGIRRLYRRGSGLGPRWRHRMNGWSYGEAQRQLVYKSRWVGLPIIRLSRSETRGTSAVCPRCGERLQSDKRLIRKLWCGKCRVVMDRDMVAAINLSRRGRVRSARSRPPIILEAQGRAVEAVKGNPTPTVIPGVDAPKSSHDSTSEKLDRTHSTVLYVVNRGS